MRVLVVGSGGREDSLLHSLSLSPGVTDLVAYPGREGFQTKARLASGEGTSPDAILAVAEKEEADLTVVGPEVPLVAGVADRFARAGRRLFGPSRAAARIEGSKIFAKEVMRKSGVPTGRHRVVRFAKEMAGAIADVGLPAAVKADGLAAGKGVVIVRDEGEALAAARRFLEERALGEAGSALLVEEFLEGEELSVLALVRDEDFLLFPPSRDYKRIHEGGRGPNTGGMGAISPVPGVDREMLDRVGEEVFRPVLRTLAADGAPYRGILYGGIILTRDGPKVLEFNCRFGDPETQAVLMLVEEDLLPRFAAVASGEWIGAPLAMREEAAVCVVLAAAGYPGTPRKGDVIDGLDGEPLPGTTVLHAGTERRGGEWVTAGGRVLNIVTVGETIDQALERAYRGADAIRFDGKQMRRDIGRPGVQG